MKIFRSIDEYLKMKGYTSIKYVIENEKIYFQIGSEKGTTDLVFVKKIYSGCKKCKYFSICENVINKQSLQSTGHTSAIIFNDYCEFEEEYK